MFRKLMMSLLVLTLAAAATACSSGNAEAPASAAAETPAPAAAEEKTYQYYTAEQTKAAIENNAEIILLDIQVEDEWNAHHIEGAVPTYAYPVKTPEDEAKLAAILPDLAGEQPIIVICPGGAGGATRSIDYLMAQGVAPERLFILENGQSKWPYEELLAK
ncbi:rhodanese-like domain-containing protein [Acidaminobacter sp.]|uniref:rhodanese-like domain-containing protein n=1 Tax=Acidaminobacter sp. TaxID=1872102 RepID=UPI0013801389|nr:rhodanese-like domain-containing protein [Acidaminobacter sp.]MDK9712234.1 rhodanese-like domain-containing protein [Acidaminobacter sp.]MZQ97320.1 rhodanese-like domain-containing protein [Acidaminobacter sp.]